MHDDELMDRLLSEALAAKAPELSPEFDARLMRRVRPRRLTSTGRWVLAVYAVVAAAGAAWLMRDAPLLAIVATLAISVPIAIGASAYGRHIAIGD
jgi:hypothetical protein